MIDGEEEEEEVWKHGWMIDLGRGGVAGKTDGRTGLERYNFVAGSFSLAVWKVWSNDLTC